MFETWKYVREDKAQHYRWMMLTAPLGKTPMDKRGGQSLRSYSQKLDRALQSMTPWTDDSKFTALRRKHGKRMRESDSQVVVTFDADDDPQSPLFKGATLAGDRTKKKAED